MHSPSKTERLWFSHLLESQSLPSPEDTPLTVVDEQKKKRIHELLARSEVFDNFLQLKFPNLKRVSLVPLTSHTLLNVNVIQYGLEGGESMLPALDSLFSAASQGTITLCSITLTLTQRRRDPTHHPWSVLFHRSHTHTNPPPPCSNAPQRPPQSPHRPPQILSHSPVPQD